jgi:hypothetical protein
LLASVRVLSVPQQKEANQAAGEEQEEEEEEEEEAWRQPGANRNFEACQPGKAQSHSRREKKGGKKREKEGEREGKTEKRV